MGSAYLQGYLYLDRCVQREAIDGYCRARVFPGFTEDRQEKFGATIEHLRAIRETIDAVNETLDHHNSAYRVERAKGSLGVR